MRSGIAAIIYHTIMMALFPITVTGYVIWVGNAFLGNKSGVSGTAQSPLFARWLEHNYGTRPDEPANRLMMVIPGVPRVGIHLVASPMLIAYRVTGYVPSSVRYPFTGEVTLQNQSLARQTFYDRVVEQYLPTIPQFVILGAGFDTRAFRLPVNTPVHCFEVDTPKTIAAKRDALAKADIARANVRLVAADFEQQDWLTQLVGAGFNPAQRALFICEGVLPYLDKSALEDTLRKIAGTAKGSVLAFDYFTSEVLESPALVMRLVRTSLRAAGEPLKFGIDSTPPLKARVAELLHSCGLSLREQQTAGDESGGGRAWGGLAVAIVEGSKTVE
jgi:methyltransferase (TIGR00027 family)